MPARNSARRGRRRPSRRPSTRRPYLKLLGALAAIAVVVVAAVVAVRWLAPPELTYATVHKTREKGRVVKVETRVIFGNEQTVQAALRASPVSRHVNTAFIERHNGTDRNRNARKVRKTYCFSKDWDVHQAVTSFTLFSYNFCWPVRTLATPGDNGRLRPRTPAMAAGLTDHVWPLREWLSFPFIQRE